MAKISLTCPMCESAKVYVEEWAIDHEQKKPAPLVRCPTCRWRGFLKVRD